MTVHSKPVGAEMLRICPKEPCVHVSHEKKTADSMDIYIIYIYICDASFFFVALYVTNLVLAFCSKLMGFSNQPTCQTCLQTRHTSGPPGVPGGISSSGNKCKKKIYITSWLVVEPTDLKKYY